MDKPKIENLFLKTAKKGKVYGMEIKWYNYVEYDGEINNEKIGRETPKEIHKELDQLFKDLKPSLIEVIRMNTYKVMVESENFAASKQQKDAIDKCYAQVLQEISVTGVNLNGTEEDLRIVITGTIRAHTGQKIAVNSPNIQLNNDFYGFEENIKEIVKQLKIECYRYYFDEIKGQLNLSDHEAE